MLPHPTLCGQQPWRRTMTNRSRRAFAILVPVILAVTVMLTVEAAGKPPADIPVTTTIADFGGGYPLRVESDTRGSYVNTSQVTSLVGSSGDWVLTTYYKSKGNFYTP